jgi:hypothetical protein
MKFCNITSNVYIVDVSVIRRKKNHTKLGVVIYNHKLLNCKTNIIHATTHKSQSLQSIIQRYFKVLQYMALISIPFHMITKQLYINCNKLHFTKLRRPQWHTVRQGKNMRSCNYCSAYLQVCLLWQTAYLPTNLHCQQPGLKWRSLSGCQSHSLCICLSGYRHG